MADENKEEKEEFVSKEQYDALSRELEETKSTLEKARSALKNALHMATAPAEEDTDDFAAKIAAAYKKLKKEAK